MESFLEQDLILKMELEERKLRDSVQRSATKAKTQTMVAIKGRGRGSLGLVEACFIVFEAEEEEEEEDGGMLMRENRKLQWCVGIKEQEKQLNGGIQNDEYCYQRGCVRAFLEGIFCGCGFEQE